MPGSQCSQYKTRGRNGPHKVPTIRVFFRVSHGDKLTACWARFLRSKRFLQFSPSPYKPDKEWVGRGPSRPEGGGKQAPRVPLLASAFTTRLGWLNAGAW